ncbi:uncharacterized protein LOC129729856 isoform X2 [Wyeomyia smithii]|uniref:uncharacterized protein LOC129729856 isoform X2 n=1 Tax=Wyeomyia smithii TaxID=174621 RepID=UPI002467FF7E|nr:uncharacterized protein LOC129729856 isoform X2 [Wyeomyia smithii]
MAPPGFPKERRKKTHGLYFHSSPPKVLQMNNQNLQRDNDVRARDVIKPSNIRIWLHQKRMSKLAKVLWAGQGMRLRTETSHHPKMKRFLECVPHVMGVIKDIHQAVVDNDLETLKEKTAAPMPRIVLTSKDTNGLTPLHKAAGLAHTQIVEYILSIWPSLSSDEDHTGKTPLHWAASAKNNARSFNLLVQAGADEAALDNRDKQAEYYKNKPSEIDRSLLTVIPEAPRISQQGFPAYFDWSMFTLDEDCDDSNGSQARMEPFLSQNNLLDNDVNNPSSVSKSKSVHNLTNGTLTDLPNDPDQNEPKNNGESEQQDTEENLIEAASVIPEDLQQNDRGDVETEAESVVDSAKENEPDTATEDIETGEQTENKNIEAPKQNDNLANNNEVDNGWLELVENGQENGENRDEESVKNDNQTAAMVNGGIEQNDVPAEAINQLDSEGNVQETVENAKNLEDGELVEQENGSENIDKDNSDKADNYVDTSEVDENKNDQNFEKSSNESTTIDVNGNLGDTNDAQSRQSSAKLKENNITTLEQTSRPVSTHSAKQNELQTKSAASVRSSVNSAKSASAKSIRSASTASQNNNDEILAEPAASVDGIQSTHTSRPSTTISNNSKSASSRAASTASTVRNASAGSALQNGRQSAKSSATAKETRPDQDGLENEEEDSNDDSNQADVEIVHYKASDEDANKDRFSAKARNDQSGVQEPPNEATDGETIEVPFNKEQIAIINNGPLESITQNDDAAASKAINATNYPENAPDSPSSTLAIEGTVEGEPDAGQLHSAKPVNRLDSSHGRSLQDIINSGDMEQLAVIVLDGKGSKLLGYRSELPEIQAFLENVPSYMNKIRRVHTAARKGSLRDLQSALDRRKFATAKDEISPHGATPLHVATIFGHSGIVRYLAGRFPETTGATDDQGRTPLHYAATLKDNGHFYNLLTHLGANPKAEDNLNHPAEFYLNHDEANELLSHRQLLQDYGAEEDLVDEMLSDQVPDDQHSARRELDDVDTLTTLERCFKIIHEPVVDLMKSVDLPTNSVPGSASSLRILITSYLAKFLKQSVFDKVKKRQTKLDHNLFDVIWPAMKKATKEKKIDEDLNVGIVIPDYDVFVVFQEFLVPLIKDMHCMDMQQNFEPHPAIQFFPRYTLTETSNPHREGNGHVLRENPDEIQLNLDTSGKFITGVVIECCRNLDDFEFPLNLSIAHLERVERILTSKILSMAFAAAIGEEQLGTYYTMNEVLENPSEIRTILAATGLLIPMLDHSDPYQLAESIAINGRFWPYGRGVYVSHNQDLVAWINTQEHIRVLVCTSSQQPANIGATYSKIGRAMNFLEGKIQFKHSYFLGYLVSRPSFLGTGFKITLTLELPHLRKERENLRHLCVVRELHLLTSEDLQSVRMSNMRSLSLCEWQIFQNYTSAITNIVALEKELSLSNSLHIAATLLKIFQHNGSQVEIPLFRTEEGRYLATSLGDPLIKGLTEVANKRPADPITYLANYLYNFANQNRSKTSASSQTSAGKNDRNNNSIEFEIKQDSEKELESSARTEETAQVSPRQNGKMAESEMERDDQGPPSRDGSGSATTSDNRDEHGQSMLHFACARSHGKNALIQLIEESGTSITFRDELYRTARDVSLQATQPDNAREIDRYVLGLAARGDLELLSAMLLDGYDHIVDVTGSDGTTIMQVASSRGHREIVRFLEGAREFEENREDLLNAVRERNLQKVVEITQQSDGNKLAKAKNYYGRSALHIAVVMESEEIVEYLATNFKQTLKIGDNLERTPLHYAMGVGNVEAISRILIKNGAKRVSKDLKGRQPSYYFMNKADILRLQEEEKQ